MMEQKEHQRINQWRKSEWDEFLEFFTWSDLELNLILISHLCTLNNFHQFVREDQFNYDKEFYLGNFLIINLTFLARALIPTRCCFLLLLLLLLAQINFCHCTLRSVRMDWIVFAVLVVYAMFAVLAILADLTILAVLAVLANIAVLGCFIRFYPF